jgi:hypothetical protein
MDNTESFPSAAPESAERAPSTSKGRLGGLIRYGLLTIGAAGAVWLLSTYRDAIGASLHALGWTAVLYLAGSAVVHVINTWGWRSTIVERPLPMPFWSLLASRLAGEALNKTTPTASLGGEPLKAYMLIWRGVPGEKAFLSVLLSRYAMTLAQIAFILVGVGLALWLKPGHYTLFAGFGIFPLIVLGAIVAATLADLGVRRLAEPRASENTSSKGTLGMWKEAGNFFWRTPGALAISVSWFFAGWAAGVLELLIATHLLGIGLSVPEALAFEGLMVSLNMATFFIPGNVGSQEGGFALLAPLFGLSAAEGVTLAVLRRLRDVVWILLGLGYAAWARKPAGVPAPAPQEA